MELNPLIREIEGQINKEKGQDKTKYDYSLK